MNIKQTMKWGVAIVATLINVNMVQSVCALDVDNFESYASTSELEAAWVDSPTTNPVQTIETSIVHSGSQSMKIEYNDGIDPDFFNQWNYTFASNQDWSSFGEFNMWVRSVAGATSLEDLTFQLKDEFGGTLGESTISTQIGDSWTEWSIDMTSFTGLSGVKQISFGTYAKDELNGFGQGTLYFDDMTVEAIPEPTTLGLMMLGGLGMLLVIKKSRRPQVSS